MCFFQKSVICGIAQFFAFFRTVFRPSQNVFDELKMQKKRKRRQIQSINLRQCFRIAEMSSTADIVFPQNTAVPKIFHAHFKDLSGKSDSRRHNGADPLCLPVSDIYAHPLTADIRSNRTSEQTNAHRSRICRFLCQNEYLFIFRPTLHFFCIIITPVKFWIQAALHCNRQDVFNTVKILLLQPLPLSRCLTDIRPLQPNRKCRKLNRGPGPEYVPYPPPEHSRSSRKAWAEGQPLQST